MTRAAVRETLENHLRRCEYVTGMWEAGSEAFGRADGYSDLDIGILAHPGANDKVWDVVDAAFDEIGGLALLWNEPNPLFQGMDKRTFRPIRTSRWLQVDIGMFPETAVGLHNQPERYGRINVLFDYDKRLVPPPWDEQRHRRRKCEELHQNLMQW